MTNRDETGWLLERAPDGHPVWFSLEDGEPGWTSNSAEALRFSRQADAALFSAHYLEESLLVRETEHMWLQRELAATGPKHPAGDV